MEQQEYDQAEIERMRLEALALVQASKPVEIGEISFICSEPYYFKSMLDIIADSTHTGEFRFYDFGLCLPHTNKDRTVVMVFAILETDGFLNYSRNFFNGYTSQKKQYTSCRVLLKQASNAMGGYDKKKCMTMVGRIYQDDVIYSMSAAGQGTGRTDRIPCDNQNEILDYTEDPDILNTYYTGCKPRCKVILSQIHDCFSVFKKVGCDTAKFVLVGSSRIEITGVKNGVEQTKYECDSYGQMVSSSSFGGCPMNIGGLALVLNDYSVSINFSKCAPWMVKMSKLSTPNSLVKIYMEKDKPVIIVTCLSTIGTAVFAFKNDLNTSSYQPYQQGYNC